MISYIARHWRGEESLPFAYWVNGVLVLAPFNIYFRAMATAYEYQPPETVAALAYGYGIPFALWLPVIVWSMVGIWRSAGHRIAEGKLGWSWVARIIVAVNFVMLAYNVVTVVRSVNALLYMENVERTARVEVVRHGNRVIFVGLIDHDSERKLTPMLKDPAITELVIASNGGFMQPALRLAALIHARGLTVIAVDQCDSACAVLLAAGKIRATTPITEIDFHSASAPGFAQAEMPGPDEEDRYYVDAGLTPAMLVAVHSHHGSTDFYRPTLRALIECGYLTDMIDTTRHGRVPAKDWCSDNFDLCNHNGKDNAAAARENNGEP